MKQAMKDFIEVFYILLILSRKITANYILEIALARWENPFKAEFDLECCDEDVFYPNCSIEGSCQTRFDICLQPFSSSLSNTNCPYGRYSTNHDNSFPDPDNITFTFGVNIEGNVPNPMTFYIPESLTEGIRLTVDAYEEDSSTNDDFIDVVRIAFPSDSLSLSSEFSDILLSKGDHGVGTLGIRYRILCIDGYCGDTCNQLCSQNTSSTQPQPQPQSQEFDYWIIIFILVVVCFLFLLLMVINSIIIIIVCRARKRSIDEQDTPTEHSNTSTPTVPVSNTYKEYITPLTRTVTYSTNFSSNSSLPQEDYYYSTLIQDNINTLSSPPEPTGLYMNPAYGSKCNN